MNNNQKTEQLAIINCILLCRSNEVAETAQRAWELLAKDNDVANRIASKRIGDVEELLRAMALRCVRLADEVATLKG